jgi:hypothetical protein
MGFEDVVLQTCGSVDGGEHISVELECEELHIHDCVDGDENVRVGLVHVRCRAVHMYTTSGAHSIRLPPSVEHLEGQVGGSSLDMTQVAAGSMVAPRSMVERMSSPDGIALASACA